MPMSPLPVSFYQQSVNELAPQLLGARLVRKTGRQRTAGYIIETEAYVGESDLACHARAGRTPRTEIMYGAPGHAYIYFIYGMHWMLNVVAEPEGSPAAVLIRAVLPSEGAETIAARRKKARPKDWANGPARVCQAFEIDNRLNGIDLTYPGICADNEQDNFLWIETGAPVLEKDILTGPRVGIDRVPEPWLSKPWRYRIDLSTWNLPPDAYRV